VIDVLTWRWGDKFGPEYVNRLASMLSRHLHVPHRLHCFTDDASGVIPSVACHPAPDPYPAHMVAGKGRASRSCFRRIRMYDRDMADLVGPRILHLDLDVVIVGDVTPLFDRPEPLVVYDMENRKGRVSYNPSVLLMDAGVLHHMREEFDRDPAGVWQRAKSEGWTMSDMAVLGLYASRVRPPTWGRADGVLAYYRDVRHAPHELPEGARMVLFYGDDNPGDQRVAAKPWVAEHWR
jgi:hypothetical protein